MFSFFELRAFTVATIISMECEENEENFDELYVQVTVHRDKLRIKQPTRCIKHPKFILS